jgi:Fur family transcriptional regulator, ferric uptake regulator
MYRENLKTILKENGSSLTRTRQLIFDLMINQEPQSMQVLAQRAKDEVDRATVYRTVELFERIGIVNRLNIGWKYKVELSDLFADHHHHMHCERCGKIIDMPANPMLETMIDTVAGKTNFSPRGHSLEIYGLCPACSA